MEKSVEVVSLTGVVGWFEKWWAQMNCLTVQDRAVQVGFIRWVEDCGVYAEGVQRQGGDKGMKTVRCETKRRDRARRVRWKLWENTVFG